MHMKATSAPPSQFLSSSSSFYIMLHIKRDKYVCVFYGVLQTSLHMKIKLTLRNMNGRLHCCYQKSPYRSAHT